MLPERNISVQIKTNPNQNLAITHHNVTLYKKQTYIVESRHRCSVSMDHYGYAEVFMTLLEANLVILIVPATMGFAQTTRDVVATLHIQSSVYIKEMLYNVSNLLSIYLKMITNWQRASCIEPRSTFHLSPEFLGFAWWRNYFEECTTILMIYGREEHVWEHKGVFGSASS